MCLHPTTVARRRAVCMPVAPLIGTDEVERAPCQQCGRHPPRHGSSQASASRHHTSIGNCTRHIWHDRCQATKYHCDEFSPCATRLSTSAWFVALSASSASCTRTGDSHHRPARVLLRMGYSGVLPCTVPRGGPRCTVYAGEKRGSLTAASFLRLLNGSTLSDGRCSVMRLIAAVNLSPSRYSGSAHAGRRERPRRISCRHSSCTAPTLNDARGRQQLGSRNSSQEGYGCSGVLQ